MLYIFCGIMCLNTKELKEAEYEKYGFIGAGNMGYAMLKGLIKDGKRMMSFFQMHPRKESNGFIIN